MKKTALLIVTLALLIFNCKSGGDVSSRAEKAEIYYKKGSRLIDESKFDDAFKYLEMAIKLDPTGNCGTDINGMAYNEIGYIYYLMRDYDRALNYYNQCLKINSVNKYALLNRSNIYMLKKDWDRCLDDVNKLLSLYKNEPMLYFQRGNVYEQMNELDKSLVDYEKYLQITSPDDKNTTTVQLREHAQKAVDRIKNKKAE